MSEREPGKDAASALARSDAPSPRPAPRRGLGLAFVAPLAVAALVVGAWRDADAARAEGREAFFLGGGAIPLPRIADFSLVERSGKTVSLADLEGRPWIAGFAFTRCGGPCPELTGKMRKLQDRLAGTDVRLVTFTVDPAFDTPEVLSRYADEFRADKERWLFLTGEPKAVKKLVSESFFLPMEADASKPAGESVTHSTKLALVDRKGSLVRYFDTEDPREPGSSAGIVRENEDLARLVRRARLLGRASPLPEVNATLNAASGVLLAIGYLLITRGKVAAHRTCMLAALGVSIAFLASYVTYHAQYGTVEFPGEGARRAVYLALLASHVLLAFALVPLAARTAWLGLKGEYEAHARIARVTFPVWLYVSSTGVAVYLLLYRIYSGVP